MEHSKMNESIIPTCIVLKHTYVVTKTPILNPQGQKGEEGFLTPGHCEIDEGFFNPKKEKKINEKHDKNNNKTI